MRGEICTVLPRLLTAALVLGACAGGAGPRDAVDLTNVFLSPSWSQWMVGPIGALATSEEVAAFQALTSDEAAAAFAEQFWARRDPDPERPGNPVRELFETRAEQADRRFSEAGYLGRRTARGTVFVLQGDPAEIRYESPQRPGQEPIEVWVYSDATAQGLDGQPPQRWYRFVKEGELTVRYRGPGPPGSPSRERF